MRSLLSLLAAVMGLALAATQASAQCCYIVPPLAPDMRGPGWYGVNYCGCPYGPNYCVRPPFPPFQGMLLAPPQKGPGAPPSTPGAPGAQAPIGRHLPGPADVYVRQAQAAYAAQAAQAAGMPYFPRHLFARSPRDFFMVDTDPRTSPYSYGYASPALPAGLSGTAGQAGDRGIGGLAGY